MCISTGGNSEFSINIKCDFSYENETFVENLTTTEFNLKQIFNSAKSSLLNEYNIQLYTLVICGYWLIGIIVKGYQALIVQVLESL